MGRKRKVGSVPCPLLPSFSGYTRPLTPSAVRTSSAKKGSQHTDPSPSTYKKSRKRARQQERLATATTAPASTSLAPAVVAPLVSSVVPPPLYSAVQPVLSPPLLPNNVASDHDAAEKRTSQTQPTTSTPAEEATQQVMSPQATPLATTPRGTPQAKPKATPQAPSPGMTSSAVLAQLLPATGWRLGSCWGSNCHCAAFRPPPSDTAAAAVAAAEKSTTAPLLCSSCGHRSVAHELVDSGEDQHRHHHQQRQQQQALSSHYRYSSGGSHAAAAGATAQETGVRLRRLFSAIRNARAVGHCDLYEDSEGVRGWGAGWFLSR